MDSRGVEPLISQCHCDVFPTILRAHCATVTVEPAAWQTLYARIFPVIYSSYFPGPSSRFAF